MPAPVWPNVSQAGPELTTRLVEAGEPVTEPLVDGVARDFGAPVSETTLLDLPFVTIRRLSADPSGTGHHGKPPWIIIPPFSGYAPVVTSPLLASALKTGDVIVTDWVDARLVPRSMGPFGLRDQVMTLLDTIHLGTKGSVVVALSQSTIAAIAAFCLNDKAEVEPAALALLGGPIDARVNAQPLHDFLRFQPLPVIEAQCLARVPQRFEGTGRRVYPGLFQMLAYAWGSPSTYLDAQNGLLAELAGGGPAARSREHKDLHSLMDVPAELFLDTVAVAFKQFGLAEGKLAFDGRRVDLARLDDRVVLTVEGERDDLVGPGQCHALSTIRPQIRNLSAETIESARHHDLFTGALFLEEVAPLLHGLYDRVTSELSV
ncbi:MAG: hypothetical protein ACFB6S_08520 [Geminicoccaceae bacterium]